MKNWKFEKLSTVFLTAMFVIVLGLDTLLASFAIAQEKANNPEDLMETSLDTMTVTAQKKEENAQDVPMSLSVFSDVQLEDADIQEASDLMRFSPNVYMRDAVNLHQTTIRGVSSFVNSLHSAAGFYVDDINLPTIYMQNPKLFDVERIEILKGPQGTLYGRNTESGVINIMTRQPDNEMRGKLFAEYGFYDTEHGTSPSYQTGGSFSGPIHKDKFYLGFAGNWENSDGFMKNDYNDDEEAGKINRLNGRGTLRWTPTDRWNISLIADAMDGDDKVCHAKYINGSYATERHEADWDSDYGWDQKGNSQALRINYEVDGFDLLSVTGRRDYEENFDQDGDQTPLPMYLLKMDEEENLISQELRISSPSDHGPFEWLVGVYGFKEEINIEQVLSDTRLTDINIDGYAAFAQGTYTFFNKLHLTTGLRYDYTDLEGDQEYISTDASGNLQHLNYKKESDNSEILPKLSVAYDFSDNMMTYASVSKGYLAGGYDYSSATSVENFTYEPEYTWNYEIGLKTSWLGNALIANISAFYIDMEDKQVSLVDQTLIQTTLSNAAKAHSMGVELEFQARPSQGLDIFAGFGYTKAKIDDWTATEWNDSYTGLIQYDYDDKYLPNAPEYTYNLGVQYRHQSRILGRVDILGTGDFYHDAKNQLKEDAYELVNLKLGYEGEHFDIIFWCKNLFDKEYANVSWNWIGVGTAVIDGDPRMMGATVTYRF